MIELVFRPWRWFSWRLNSLQPTYSTQLSRLSFWIPKLPFLRFGGACEVACFNDMDLNRMPLHCLDCPHSSRQGFKLAGRNRLMGFHGMQFPAPALLAWSSS